METFNRSGCASRRVGASACCSREAFYVLLLGNSCPSRTARFVVFALSANLDGHRLARRAQLARKGGGDLGARGRAAPPHRQPIVAPGPASASLGTAWISTLAVPRAAPSATASQTKYHPSLSIAADVFGDRLSPALDFPATLVPDLTIDPRADVFARAFGVTRIAAIAVSPHSFDPTASLQLNDRRLSDDVPKHLV